VIERAMRGEFEGGVLVGTLENGGVGLAPFHDMEDDVPEDLQPQVEELRASIISGDLMVGQ
jgi:basic membrane protein A